MCAASPPGQSADEPDRLTLPRDLGELLVHLSIGVRRHAMYPDGHPALGPVSENVISRLGELFSDRDRLAIGVTRNQLVIDGVATDPDHPVLRNLARRLHDHELGGLILRKGIVAREMQELLHALSRDPESGTPLANVPDDDLPEWDHVSLHPVGYEKLELRRKDAQDEEAEGRDPVLLLWLGLVQAALGADEPLSPGDVPEGGVLAESIRSGGEDADYDQVIVGYLLQLAEEQKGAQGEDAKAIRERVSELVRELDDETLERLLGMGGDKGRLRRFILDANKGLAVDAVMKLLKNAAASSGQTISDSMTRMLTKLSRHARNGPDGVRTQADTALRDHVEELIDDWELEDPNPHDYTDMLESIARAEPVIERPEEETAEKELAGPHRLVQTALEVDAFGPTVREAVSALVAEGDVSRLLDLLDGAPPESETADEIRRYLTRPDQLRRLLSGEDVDPATLQALIEWMGAAAVDPLLDALVESEVRAVRRKVFEVLAGMEEGVGDAVMKRLGDDRWFVVRNMLALIKRWSRHPEGFDPLAYLEHPDPRVRREAFPIALQGPGTRTRALAAGLSDTDDRLVRISLIELRDRGLPDALLPTLVNRVVRGEHSDDLRALAVRLLDGVDAPLARDAVVELADGGKTLLVRQRVAAPSPPVLAALRVLLTTWSGDGKAGRILDAARRSKDPQIRDAVREEDGESGEEGR